jgi:peptide/nickel transport system permease protein
MSDFSVPAQMQASALVSDDRNMRWRRIRKHTGLVLGSALLLAIILLALAAPLIAPYDPYHQDLARRMVPPVWHANGGWDHPLGTDNLGRDYFSRLLYGGQISLMIGLVVMLISGMIGTTLGLVGGYFGGRVDAVVTFITTTKLAMPLILIALAVVATLGSSLLVVMLVLGFLKWERFAVVVRAATQQARSQEYVAAARSAGASSTRIILTEILPNIVPQLVVVATVEAASAILIEASLSFLGLGVQPPLPSWGLMIAEAKAYMFFSFWMIALPGAALALLVLSINMVGDGIRDVSNPEGRN